MDAERHLEEEKRPWTEGGDNLSRFRLYQEEENVSKQCLKLNSLLNNLFSCSSSFASRPDMQPLCDIPEQLDDIGRQFLITLRRRTVCFSSRSGNACDILSSAARALGMQANFIELQHMLLRCTIQAAVAGSCRGLGSLGAVSGPALRGGMQSPGQSARSSMLKRTMHSLARGLQGLMDLRGRDRLHPEGPPGPRLRVQPAVEAARAGADEGERNAIGASQGIPAGSGGAIISGGTASAGTAEHRNVPRDLPACNADVRGGEVEKACVAAVALPAWAACPGQRPAESGAQAVADARSSQGEPDGGNLGVFNSSTDDEQVLRLEFDRMDADHDQFITLYEIEAAAKADLDRSGFLDALKDLLKDRLQIDFKAFKEAADQIPRAKGQRVQWAGSLGLDSALARYLRAGDLFDQLKGIKEMPDSELETACSQFAEKDLLRIVRAGRDSLRNAFRSGLKSEAESANQKFSETGSAVTARYAGLEEFIEGPEGLIGQPNPRLEEGIRIEHCSRASANELVVAPNYGVCTTSCWEWHWLVDAGSKQLPGDLNLRMKAHEGMYPGEVGDEIFETAVRFAISYDGHHDGKSKAISDIIENLKKQFESLTVNDIIQTTSKLQEMEIYEALARGFSVISEPAVTSNDYVQGELVLPCIWFLIPEASEKFIWMVAAAAGVSESVVTLKPHEKRRVLRFSRFTDPVVLRERLSTMSAKQIESFIQEISESESPQRADSGSCDESEIGESEPFISSAGIFRVTDSPLKSEELKVAAKKIKITLTKMLHLMTQQISPTDADLEEVRAAFEGLITALKAQNIFLRQGRFRQPKLKHFYQQLLSKYSDLLTKAKMDRLEILALCLYTGPLYILYNAVLRGFPKNLVDLLNKTSTAHTQHTRESQCPTVHGNR